MSDSNVIPADFTPQVPPGTGTKAADGTTNLGQAQEPVAGGVVEPPNTFLGLTQEEVLALEPLNEEEVKTLLSSSPRLARNLFNISGEMGRLYEMLARENKECQLRGKLLAGLLYQSGGKITIDCLPMSKVKGDEGFNTGEGRFKSTVIAFQPKMVSKSLVQG